MAPAPEMVAGPLEPRQRAPVGSRVSPHPPVLSIERRGAATARFRTIQVYPKDVGGICGHTRSVNRPTLFKLTHQGRREGDHDAPLFAKPPMVGSAGHRLPAKYLGWSECARSRGFSGLVVHGTPQDGRPT